VQNSHEDGGRGEIKNKNKNKKKSGLPALVFKPGTAFILSTRVFV
jgi:hypothetical protein